ncbi:SDR family NAD(P)-dependent oxidoreductase [Nocardia sp. BMG111209]|uniref:SDR family NAD(P)-dependent oxidoreductase n=1 Tax=Nocardia sp. BMG111209 TaxID=1160137 RepID=UPI000361FA53|nr:SDR family NAD(P)-dependent oxidoreductase [Nocardia sp. BMG111209]
MRGLRDKTYVVAGGATGIGAAAAARLAEEGAAVTVGDINIAGAETTAERITRAGGRAIAVEFDLADDKSVQAMVDRTIAEFGGVHGLFNVGADLSPGNIGRDKTVLETEFDVWQRTLDVNLLGYVRTVRAVLPHLLAHGGGSIVNTSSGTSVGGDPSRVAYGVSKAGVNQLTRHIAINYGRRGIRANGVMPGLVMGETVQNQNDVALQEAFLTAGRTTRLGVPDDLASVVSFLLSDEAEWINGQVWFIGGGAHLRN